MKKIVFSIIAILFFGSVVVAKNYYDLSKRNFAPEGYHFTIEFPSPPRHIQSQDDTVRAGVFDAENGEVCYFAGYWVVSPDAIQKKTKEQIMDSVVKKMRETYPVMVSDRRSSFDGGVTRDFVLKTMDGKGAKGRLILRNDYQLVAILVMATDRHRLNAPSVNNYFASLRLN